MSILKRNNVSSMSHHLRKTQFKRRYRISWKEIKKDFGGLVWVLPGIVTLHELSHIIAGRGLNMRYGWYGFSVHGGIPEAIYGIIGVYVNEITPWTFAAGLVGSLLWIVIMKKHGQLLGFNMTKQTFCLGLVYAVWIAKWDLKWLAGEILKVLVV
jgi:hypothetical protein